MSNESTTKPATEDGSPRCAVAPCSPPSSDAVKRAEEYVETFCSLTDNTVGEVSTRLHAAVLLHEMRRYRSSESFWLGLAIAGITALLLVLLIALVLCVPWRSNVMVLQLPPKPKAEPAPIIVIPTDPSPAPQQRPL